jgi:hypothetical protein
MSKIAFAYSSFIFNWEKFEGHEATVLFALRIPYRAALPVWNGEIRLLVPAFAD